MSAEYGVNHNPHAYGEHRFSSNQPPAEITNTTSFRGQVVVIAKDPSSLLLDAQEEIAAMRAGDKTLEKRKPMRSLSATALGVELAKQYIARGEMSDVLEGGVAQGLLSRLRQLDRRNGTIDDANNELKDTLDSVGGGMAHKRFAALISFQNSLSSSLMSSEKALLQAEVQNLYAEQGMAIRAGFNTNDVTQKHRKLDDQRSLMSLYLSMVIDGPPLSEIYRGAVEKYGRNRFSEVMQFLLSAAGKDIDSIVSSKDPSALGITVTNLRKFQVLRTIESSCHSTIDILKEALKPGIGGVDIFSTVLTLVETKWPLPDSVSSEYKKLSKNTPQAIVWLHNALYNVIESVPVTVYKDEVARLVLITALADARSMVTEEEEVEVIDIEVSENNGRVNT